MGKTCEKTLRKTEKKHRSSCDIPSCLLAINTSVSISLAPQRKKRHFQFVTGVPGFFNFMYKSLFNKPNDLKINGLGDIQ